MSSMVHPRVMQIFASTSTRTSSLRPIRAMEFVVILGSSGVSVGKNRP